MDSRNYLTQLNSATQFLQKQFPDFPKLCITLGSGLGALLDHVQQEKEISYSEIPGFHSSTAPGHAGKLILAKYENTRFLVMKGRVHFYEGLSLSDVVLPFRAIAQAGCDTFILTNAAGGIFPNLNPPELCLITDHINLMGHNPLRGPNFDTLGPRFPDMTEVYDSKLRELILSQAKKLGISLRQGVYAAVSGPCFETPAEIRFYQSIGANLVGMSTVPEAIALRHMKKRVVAVSCITNLAAGLSPVELTHDEVLERGEKIGGLFSKLLLDTITHIGHTKDTA